MEFLKGVHVIETYATTTLLVDDRLVLVDTSSDADGGKILDYLAKIKVKPKDLSTIFITHTHPDHVGGLGSIKKASQAKVAAHRIEADFISRQKTWDGPPGPQRHTPTPVDVSLDDGQMHDGLRVIFTPGHTRGSMSLLDETRSLLIAGDAANNGSEATPPVDQEARDAPLRQRHLRPRRADQGRCEREVRGAGEAALAAGHGAPIRGRLPPRHRVRLQERRRRDVNA